MRVLLHTWCQTQRASFSLGYGNCGSGHIKCSYRSIYSGFNIHLNISELLLEISRQLSAFVLKLDATYWAPSPIYALLTVVPAIYSVFTAQHIQASLFSRTYLCCNWRYLDNSMRVMLQTWCQIQRTSSSLRNVNCAPDHIQCNYSSAYLGYNIQVNESALL
jgi:hypothetical protein